MQETLGYVPAIARRFLGRGSTLDELIAAGNLGLVEAARRYDSARRVKFTTYATFWIRKAIIESLRQQSGPVRLPRYQYDKLKQLRDTRDAWSADHGRAPTVEELAIAAELSIREVQRLQTLVPEPVSLDDPVRSVDALPLTETMEDTRCETPDRAYLRRDLTTRLRGHVAGMMLRDRQVLSLRYGLHGEAALTRRETAQRLGISRERVRWVESQALARLRERL